MPSGSRKRKAAKKKREQQANSNSLPIDGNNPQGHDDTKSQDDRGSDGGEVDSPLSQDSQSHQSHQDPFSANAEDNGKIDTSSVHLMDAQRRTVDEIKKDNLTTELLGNEDGVDIKIEKAMEPEDESRSRSDKVPIVDDTRRSSSSNSSSDDESQLSAKNKMNYSMSGKVVSVIESSSLLESDYYSAVETAPLGDFVKPVLSMSEVVVHATGDSPSTAAAFSDMVECGRKENGEMVPDSSISAGTQLEGNKFPTSDTLTPDSNEIAKETKETVVVGFASSVRQRTSVFSCCGLFDVFASSEK